MDKDKKTMIITIIVTTIFAIGIVFLSFDLGFNMGYKKSKAEVMDLKTELLDLANFDPEERYITKDMLKKFEESGGDIDTKLSSEGVIGRVYSINKEDGNTTFLMITGKKRGVIRVLINDDTDLIEQDNKKFQEKSPVMVLGDLLEDENGKLYVNAKIVKVMNNEDILNR